MRKSLLYIFSVLIFSTCVEPYDPPEISNLEDLLVINANINATKGEGEVVLTKSQSLSSTDPIEYVNSASVQLELESGGTWSFNKAENGKYTLTNLDINVGEKARIRVLLNNEEEYLSDFEELKATPEIDSVSYDYDDQGVQFFVHTHDPSNETRYYKWNYEETWEFNAKYPSSIYVEIVDSVPVVSPRWGYDTLFICYRENVSKEILIGTSEKLAKDVISYFPVKYSTGLTGKFNRKYSLLVTQRALNKATYGYWKQLESNTENIGSIFDPQPFQIISNIRCVNNPSKRVIGYFNLFTETEKRIFVSYKDLIYYPFSNEYSRCELDTILVEELLDKYMRYNLVSEIRDTSSPRILGYTAATPYCSDCRILGTNKKPEWWE